MGRRSVQIVELQDAVSKQSHCHIARIECVLSDKWGGWSKRGVQSVYGACTTVTAGSRSPATRWHVEVGLVTNRKRSLVREATIVLWRRFVSMASYLSGSANTPVGPPWCKEEKG